MATTAHWISAFRLRTLPLALSVIFMGSFLAAAAGEFNTWVFLLAVTTTLFLQILSNLANDYGDSIHGADSADRIGPKRAVQSGAITSADMRKAMFVLGGLSLVSGIALIAVALSALPLLYLLIFLALGLASIAAAVKYTAGNNPYGYRGLGDVFVFIFFGLVGVAGSYYLYTNEMDYLVFLPAITMGLLSTGVLNLNNMRDIKSDQKAGKITLPVRMGLDNAKKYHAGLIIGALGAAILFALIQYQGILNLLFLLCLPLFIKHLNFVMACQNPQELDPELKKLALSTLLLCLLFGVSMLL